MLFRAISWMIKAKLLVKAAVQALPHGQAGSIAVTLLDSVSERR